MKRKKKEEKKSYEYESATDLMTHTKLQRIQLAITFILIRFKQNEI